MRRSMVRVMVCAGASLSGVTTALRVFRCAPGWRSGWVAVRRRNMFCVHLFGRDNALQRLLLAVTHHG